MSKAVVGTALLVMITFGNTASAQPYPTNGIAQEMAGTLDKGSVSIDLLNSTNFRSSVRFGMFGGEVLYTPNAAGAAGDMLGYKHSFSAKTAAYGLINYDTAADGPDLLLGFAYTGGKQSFMYSFNGEIISPGGGGDNILEIRAGGYYALSSREVGRIYIAGELTLDLNNDISRIFGALRFVPAENVHVDVGLYDSEGGGGGDSALGIPLFFRLTLGI
ncbi:hypothetical protein ACFL6R_01290 [Gemmatimonadota bacterium]